MATASKNKVSIQPMADRVVVEPLEETEEMRGGLYIPDTAKEKPQQGEVVATGPGARNERGQLVQLDVKPGDLVLFGKWSGTEVKLAGEEFLIMKESDLLGVIDKADTAKKAA